MIYDALDARFEVMRYSWDPDNPLSGTKATIRDLSVHVGFAEACAAE